MLFWMKKNPDNIPATIYVVELSKYILVTGFPVGECVFPCYRFDKQISEAFRAADIIGYEKNKRELSTRLTTSSRIPTFMIRA